ncbi:hypothetical protein ACFSC3_04375 [Sphingomonas floccifaciens]|uniref:Glycosyltransferase RgtA/B/C/D-like domain-containing protein n=1 Tax=Sphingomonas floccifaciens TaxID=1844115 RepID=A0ABW4N9Y5_9SPHN
MTGATAPTAPGRSWYALVTDPRHRLAVLAIVAVAARALSFGNPMVHVDEQFYFLAASRMWDGALPFVDVWDRKPIGLFLLYAPAAALPLPWGTFAYQAMALGFVVATAMLVARLAVLAGWARGATFAGIAYILWLNPMGGVGGQSPVLYNLSMTAAALLTATASGPHRRWRGLAALALVGLSLQIKYSVVFEGMAFGLWLLWGEWRATRSPLRFVGYGVALVLVAILPTAAAYATYAALGHGEAFVYANFTSILARKPDPFGNAIGHLEGLALMLSPLVAMAFGSRRAGEGGDADVRRLLFLWFAVNLAGILAFGGWYEHYGLPAAAPGAACSAGFLGARHWRGRATPAILGIVALLGLGTVIVNRVKRGGPGQLAALTAAVGQGPGCLYVFSGPSIVYRTTGRCTLTAYIFPPHMEEIRERGAIGVDQIGEVRRIFAQRPAVVVMRRPYPGEQTEIQGVAIDELMRGYRRRTTLPIGNLPVMVYERR